MIKSKYLIFFFLTIAYFIPLGCRALVPGTLLYRTSASSRMFGYSGDPLIEIVGGQVKNLNSGHVGIYIGKENGIDYIVEAMASGIVKTPAQYFVNRAEGEAFLGARLPQNATPLQLAKVVALAKSLAGKNLAYDFDFKKQKGPDSGAWTCVGLTEKIYESANISNPNNLNALEYDPEYYAVDITPDGFDNSSFVNTAGDCFSKTLEFSKIARLKKIVIPAPELIGYDAGLIKGNERYVFLPYTQFLQPSLKAVPLDINIVSSFDGALVRASFSAGSLALRWSLINNPWSSLKIMAGSGADLVTQVAAKAKDLALSIKDNFSSAQPGLNISLNDSTIQAQVNKNIKTTTTAKTTTNKTTDALKQAAVVGPQVAVKVASVLSGNISPAELISTANALKEVIDYVGQSEKNSSSGSLLSSMVTPNAASSVVSERESHGASGSWSNLALINKIYADSNNQWVELINPTDVDFDLAAAGYRLEKAKTASDPALVMRIGNPEDGYYPGGTTIKAHGRYLIVSDRASAYYKSQAQALATREDFVWTGKAYTLYLGVAAISSPDDPDIIDAVGFGAEAKYFQGAGPAPAITEHYILSRLDFTNDNRQDFELSASADPSINWALTANTTSNMTSSASNSISTSTAINTVASSMTSTINRYPLVQVNVASSTSNAAATSTTNTVASSTTSTTSTSTSVTATSTTIIATTTPVKRPVAIINKIYSTGTNDWLELLNIGDEDFNLADAQYRLEKTKTATDSSLMLRIGDEADGAYPGGTIIKAHNTYLIVRDDASDYFKNQADAIALRDEFSWADSGYTIYVGDGPISTNIDPEIIDAVGFGPEAVYFQGQAPAPAIIDNYVLNRVGRSGRNNFDFNLILTDDPSIIVSTSTTATSSSWQAYVPPVPLVSDGLAQVWHFDECYGSGSWGVGRWGCARELNFSSNKFSSALSQEVNLNQFSISFYYRSWRAYPRLNLNIKNAAAENIARLIIEPGLLTVEGLPESDWRYYKNIPWSNDWHQATLVVNQDEDYWAVYIDGQEMVKENFWATLGNISSLEFEADCEPFGFDEVALWSRSLSALEIAADYLAAAPYNPLVALPTQLAPQLLYSWQFEEDTGNKAIDSVQGATLNVSPSVWVGRYHDNYAATVINGQEMSFDWPAAFYTPDLSLTLWWRDSSPGNYGRANINLLGGVSGGEELNLFSLLMDSYRLDYWFNGNYGILDEGVDEFIANDNLWHHLALVYDSYRYRLQFYVDGELRANSSLIWMPPERKINKLRVSTDGYPSEIDNLSIYSGALNEFQIKEIYNSTK